MTRGEAVRSICIEWGSRKNTKTAGNRLIKALRLLDVPDDEILEMLTVTGYADGNGIVMDGVKFDVQS